MGFLYIILLVIMAAGAVACYHFFIEQGMNKFLATLVALVMFSAVFFIDYFDNSKEDCSLCGQDLGRYYEYEYPDKDSTKIRQETKYCCYECAYKQGYEDCLNGLDEDPENVVERLENI